MRPLLALITLTTASCALGAPTHRSFDDVPYAYAEERSIWSPRSRTHVRVAHIGPASSKKPPLVLLHPWGTSMLIWQEIAPSLAADRQVWLMDLPGHGKSSKPPGRYPLRRLVGAVLDVLDHARIPRAVLMGNSLGGATAIATALQAPERVEALVLLAAPGGEPVPKPVVTWLEHNVTPTRVATMSNEGIAVGWYMIGARTPFVSHLLAQTVAAKRSPEWMSFARAASSALKEVAVWTPRIEAIRAPTLVVQGLDDPVVWRWSGRTLASRISTAELFEIDGCGHCPQLECPQVLLPRVEAFLSQLGG